ncbi:MAG TPA: VTT domain-containing protein [Bryobacteraceae bacterium]|nr:VTT domain-containing protein [Bryobacteraceae bacterium]
MSWGPAGVFVLAVFDSGGIPVVGGVDALVVLVSALDHSQAFLAGAAAILGSVIGSLVLFYIARKGGEAYLQRYTASGRGAKFRAWFLEYGLLTVFVPAFVPVIPMPVKIFILSAGALGVRPVTFTLVLAAARIPRYFFLAWLGTRLGRETIPYLRHHIWDLVALAAALFVLLYIGIRVAHARRSKARQP